MKFSRKTQYGLRAMVYLAEIYKDKKRFCSLKEIYENENISLSYLENILSRLEKKELICSKKGSMGGYCLNHSPKKITIKDIVYALEGSTNITNCVYGGDKCSKFKTCKAFSVWGKIQKSLDATLDSITLISLIKQK